RADGRLGRRERPDPDRQSTGTSGPACRAGWLVPRSGRRAPGTLLGRLAVVAPDPRGRHGVATPSVPASTSAPADDTGAGAGRDTGGHPAGRVVAPGTGRDPRRHRAVRGGDRPAVADLSDDQ